MSPLPLSLYIHIPWCERKCPYCDFNSHVNASIPESEYVKALIADLNSEKEQLSNRRFQTVFIGGGTPSLFSEKSIATILTHASNSIGFAPDIEITMEANPGSVEQKKFLGLKAAGVNRLSIGVQSFQSQHLQALGRIHNREEALSAVATAFKAGFENINLDLMHGLPHQSLQQSEDDLHQAVALAPTHISWYQLTIEPNTEFFSRPPALPLDEEMADIQAAGEHILGTAGYKQYEVSAYAAGHHQSAHNLNYWQFGDYLGIGAGAHSKLTDVDTHRIYRFWKTRLPDHYLNRQHSFTAGERQLESSELPLEFMMNALRLTNGVSMELFEHRTGLPIDTIIGSLEALNDKGLITLNNERISTTALGKRFLNDLLTAF